jgi:hypothetical protein
VADREQIVDDLEAVFACREIGTCDSAELGKLGGGIVWERLESCVGNLMTWIPTLQEFEDGDDARGGNVDGEFILPDGELLDVLGQASHYPGTVAVEVLGLALIFVGRIDDGDLEAADMVPWRLSQVLRVLGDCDILSGGGRKAA